MHKTGIDPHSLSILKKISDTKLAENYYLAGGTACALHLNHRLSIDLDYFSLTPMSPEEIRNTLYSLGELQIFQNDQGTFNGQLNNTKISFFVYPFQLLDKPEKFADTSICSIRDLACMKLESIASRGVKRDFVDLYHILQNHSLADVFSWFGLKYQNKNISLTHVIKSLVYFNDADDNPDPMMIVPYDWESIKKYYITNIPITVKQMDLF